MPINKLSAAQRREIATRAIAGESPTHLAREFGVSPQTVSLIRKKVIAEARENKEFYERVVHLIDNPPPPCLILNKTHEEIMRRARAGESVAALSREFGVSEALVSRLKYGERKILKKHPNYAKYP